MMCRCSFGHRFADRCGHANGSANFFEDDSCSPVFAQWMDCIWQMMEQYPSAFQFNSRFLIAILHEVYTARSGTFLRNSEFERKEIRAEKRCWSAWTILQSKFDDDSFYNPFFNEGQPNLVLEPQTHPSCLKFWAEMYFKFLFHKDSNDSVQDVVTGRLAALQQQLRTVQQEKQQYHDEMRRLQREQDRLQQALLVGAGETLDGDSDVVVEEEDEESVLITRGRRHTLAHVYAQNNSPVPPKNNSPVTPKNNSPVPLEFNTNSSVHTFSCLKSPPLSAASGMGKFIAMNTMNTAPKQVSTGRGTRGEKTPALAILHQYF